MTNASSTIIVIGGTGKTQREHRLAAVTALIPHENRPEGARPAQRR
jgi:molybdopterin biosynthesis enzyme MoaB